MVLTDGLFAQSYAIKQAFTIPGKSTPFTAWAATFMNAWNHNVLKLYLGFIT
ncbi:hypothetical protein JB92DRAFT_3036704 [Gautieria morchelliformis]|nr:hypothetical protein JB92DRAFT_3036704 [Gautieria morchelliformis]